MATGWHLALALSLSCLSYSLALDTTCFSNGGATVITSSNPQWSGDKAVFNEKINTEPAAVAYAYNQAQVQSIIQCAEAAGMKAVPRGGGHGYEGYAAQTGTIVVDVSNLTDFTLSADNSTVTFGSGFRLGDLALTMYLDANGLLPAGTCPWVGSSGQILGGGTGMSVRSYGLACDQLTGLTMVDYQGNVIQASTSQNQDLLWASCGGGGGNLGIVTTFTLKTNSLATVPYVTTAVITWSGYDSAAQVFDKAQRYFATADKRMNGQLLIGFNGVSINIQWFGDQNSATQELNSSGILSVPGYTINDLVQESFINATLRWSAGSMAISNDNINALNMTYVPAAAEKFFTAASSYNQDFMSMEGIQTMVNSISSLPATENAFVEHKFLRGAVNTRNATDTAWYWRDSLYETQWFYYWLSGDQSAQSLSWISTTKAAMAPYVGQGAYINYPDPILAASDSWPEAYYGGNLAEYRTVKTKYDPYNYFSNPLTPPPYTNGSSESKFAVAAPGLSATAPSVVAAGPSYTKMAPAPSYGAALQTILKIPAPAPSIKAQTHVSGPAQAIQPTAISVTTAARDPGASAPAPGPGAQTSGSQFAAAG